MPTTQILHLQPIQISLKDIGPFRMVDALTFDFPGPYRELEGEEKDLADRSVDDTFEVDRKARPPSVVERLRFLANVNIFHDAEGPGLEAVLDCIAALFDLMSSTGNEPGRTASAIGVRTTSQLQLDLLADCHVDGRGRRIVLTLRIGSGPPMVDWAPLVNSDPVWNIAGWAVIEFDPEGFSPTPRTDALGRSILDAVRSAEGKPVVEPVRRLLGRPGPEALPAYAQPTLIHFGRGGTNPVDGYAPARRLPLGKFEADADLLGWLSGLPKERCDRTLSELASAAFPVDRGVGLALAPGGIGLEYTIRGRTIPPTALEAHRRVLMTIHAGILRFGSRSTIVLIDGVDGQFLPTEYAVLFRSFAEIVRRNTGSTILVSTRSNELYSSFGRHHFEDGIVKGGSRGWGMRTWL